MAAVGVILWWYRRRLLAKAKQNDPPPTPQAKDAPARAEDVLNRPDPNEKQQDPPVVVPNQNNAVGAQSTLTYGSYDTNVIMGQAIGSPAQSQAASIAHNPFDDTQSIQTTGTHGSNVIQIALVPPVAPPSTVSSGPSSPNRPERSPGLNLEHLSVSQSDLRSSTSTGDLTEGNRRHSYLTSASYGSDFLNEVPMIITPVRSQVRQVLGVVKAEVIRAPSSPGQQSSLRSNANSRPPVRSPLANTSFGPADVLKEEQEVTVNGNPFTDEHTPRLSPGVSSTFGVHGSDASTVSDWTPPAPSQLWSDRPTSVTTQAGSIIADIGSATRVNVGLITPATTLTTADTPGNPHRMASARLVSPPFDGNKPTGTLEQQQQRAFSRFQDNYRDSSGSVLSAASAGEDSILESFPFVPPSPISGIPTRSPRSPTDVTPRPSTSEEQEPVDNTDLPPPPDRKTLGMSTGSQISTLSAGLGSFPFQIESPEPRDSTSSNLPQNPPGRQRASLDTLALTADLSSYPLGFDKELQENYPLRKM